MKSKQVTAGYSKNGLPYFRINGGPRNLVIFEGLSFNHKSLSGLTLWGTVNSYKHFAGQFTIYYVGRKPGLPQDYSIQNMSDDYAVMVGNEIKTPVDLMGISTGERVPDGRRQIAGQSVLRWISPLNRQAS